MLIAQALGEYAVVSAVVEGLRTVGDFLGELWRDWGLTAVAVIVTTAFAWKVLTRVR